MLDARGAIGVTERASYFGRMRDLTRRVAELYIQQREGDVTPERAAHSASAEAPALPSEAPLDGPADLVFEVGTEELPGRDVQAAIAQWSEAVPALLQRLRLPHEGVRITASPRRISAYVRGLAPRQEDLVIEVKGPAADRAFDAEGKPTAAALGFARGRGSRSRRSPSGRRGRSRRWSPSRPRRGSRPGRSSPGRSPS